MSTILELAPQNVWKHFYELTRIPRPSGHVEQITEYLVNYGKGLGLESCVDVAGKLNIRKNATPGLENRKGFIQQAQHIGQIDCIHLICHETKIAGRHHGRKDRKWDFKSRKHP